jgi:hypothetical protein
MSIDTEVWKSQAASPPADSFCLPWVTAMVALIFGDWAFGEWSVSIASVEESTARAASSRKRFRVS